jgi:hypothetical protein
VLLPLPRFSVSVASKGLRVFVSPLDAKDARHLTSVANKGVAGAEIARETSTGLLSRELMGDAGGRHSPVFDKNNKRNGL